ncbi:SDR family oxidoreductase [Nonomuraea thailandensis]|nr:SDR family oxidoreductase [Nonomuraea thailandensis]
MGAGPGIGRSVARRSRTRACRSRPHRRPETRADVAEAFGVPVISPTGDSVDETALHAAPDAASDEFGLPEVVVCNVAIIQPDTPGELPARAQVDAWAVNVVGALAAAAHVSPAMARRGAVRSSSPAECPRPSRDAPASRSARPEGEPW